MDLALSEEQQDLVSSFAGVLGRGSFPDQVRDAEPMGFDEKLWQNLIDTGALLMAVPQAQEGWGATLLDLTLVAEQVGRWAAPVPLIEGQVAARLVAALDAAETLASIVDGSTLVTLALHAARSGRATLVPAGAVSDAIVVMDGERLLVVPSPEDRRQVVANLGSAPLADVTLVGGTELAHGAAALGAFEVALDEWLVLTASALVGLGTAAHTLTCSYAVERRAFGGLIGAYQGVAHPLADDATRLDGARLLVQKAAWALDAHDPRGRELAAMAFAFASETAEEATYNAIHFHGGYGFMLEHDVQLFYRRVRGWARVWGNADDAYQRAALARYGPSSPRSA